jgi:hypothetical protein
LAYRKKSALITRSNPNIIASNIYPWDGGKSFYKKPDSYVAESFYCNSGLSGIVVSPAFHAVRFPTRLACGNDGFVRPPVIDNILLRPLINGHCRKKKVFSSSEMQQAVFGAS